MLVFGFTRCGLLEILVGSICQALNPTPKTQNPTLPQSNMEAEKGPYIDYYPFKRGLFQLPC